jgi:hypothetical protein
VFLGSPLKPVAFKSFLHAAASRENLNLDDQFDRSFLFMAMKGKINMKLYLVQILIGIVCIGLFQNAQGVVPAPDGGYPGGNTAEGQNALFSLTIGGYNTAVGFFSLRSETAGSFNTAIGAGALLANSGSATTGYQNTATGAGALLSNTAGGANTANGAFALFSNTGTGNTALGANALSNNTSGNYNTAVGTTAGTGVTTAGSVICIGVAGQNVDNSCYMGNIFNRSVDPGTATNVLVDANNKLGVVSSSKRFKRDIKPMDKASETILALKPVTFRYKSDAKNTPCFGLIAEDVEKVNPDLVVRNKAGEVLSVRYEQINAMLLNEFLKEHHKVEEQQATITQVKKDFQATVAELNARLKEQDAKIQKVSAQLEVTKAAPRAVLNNQ